MDYLLYATFLLAGVCAVICGHILCMHIQAKKGVRKLEHDLAEAGLPPDEPERILRDLMERGNVQADR